MGGSIEVAVIVSEEIGVAWMLVTELEFMCVGCRLYKESPLGVE